MTMWRDECLLKIFHNAHARRGNGVYAFFFFFLERLWVVFGERIRSFIDCIMADRLIIIVGYIVSQ